MEQNPPETPYATNSLYTFANPDYKDVAKKMRKAVLNKEINLYAFF